MKKRITAILMCLVMMASLFVGCAKDKATEDKDTSNNAATTETQDDSKDVAATKAPAGEETAAPKEIKEFTAFFDVQGIELNAQNDIKDIIAEKIGAKCKETWLVGQTAEEAVGMYIASGEYPDFMNWKPTLQEAGACVAIDEYLDKYPNIKNLWSESQWNSLKQEDGHIYSIPQFDNINVKSMETTQWGEAVWLQTRVLKWAGYPVIESLDQLFNLLEDYTAANPTMADGTPVIPYEILTYDWYYFCLENLPQFLDGHPNDGRCIVNPDTYKVSDYNFTPTAVKYFKKLNEEYKKGIIDPEFMTINHDQFLEKISSGRVLCMVEQKWDFQTAEDSIRSQKLDDCTYVPLGITIEPGMKEMYAVQTEAAVLTGGLCITTSCKDVEGALQFVNDLLDPEILYLRHWGVEGVDYMVGDDGLFYRDQTMRDNAVSTEYKQSHLCPYSYLPSYKGVHPDGKNAMTPDTQPAEFFAGLKPEVQECLNAYGAKTYLDMMDYNEFPGVDRPWYPIWSFVNQITTETPGGLAWNKMEECKHQYLPQVVIADNFDDAWAKYTEAYAECKPEDFFVEVQSAVYDRIELVTGTRPTE